MDIVLIGGLWMDGSAWDRVVPELTALGHRPVPVLLPGQGDGAAAATLADQVAAVLTAIDGCPGRPLVVGHSAASTLAWLATDARPDKVARVALIGGWPAAEGEAYAGFFEIADGAMAFPGWEPFAGADSADLDQAARDAFTAAAVPVPEGVASAVVHYADDRRLEVPVTEICPEFTPDDVREMMAEGHLPELARAKHLDLVDIDSGHWPMVSRPAELARLLAGLAG